MKANYANKLIAMTALFMLFIIGGCKKYLDQQPISSVGPEQVFSDVPSALQSLVTVYGRLTGDNAYGLKLALHYPVDEDMIMGPSGNNDDRRAMAHFSLTSLNNELSVPFNQLFEGVMLANICIDEIPKMGLYANGSDQQKKQLQRMYGEALALRAQFYYEALRNWGDLPQHFLPSYVEAAANPLPLRTNKNLLYDRILDDLKLAATLVPWRNEVASIGDQVDERLTKGAVKALRARIALTHGGYALSQTGTMERPANYLDYYRIARDETNEIITSGQHALYADYKALWKDVVCGRQTVDPAGELMFQVTAIGGGSTADSKLGYANGPRVNNGSAFQGNSFINPLPHYLYLFDSTDKRRDVTIAPYYVNANLTKQGQAITNMVDGKYRRDWIKNPTIPTNSAVQYFGLKWQLIRYSDVLLMFAEAENEVNSPSAAAYAAINQVRRRGYGLAVGAASAIDIPAGLGKADFLKYIIRERALELGAEGHRKYDLIRWNLLGTGLTEAKNNMAIMGNRVGTIVYSYMAGGPAYASDASKLPQRMFYKNTGTENADDATMWANSYYAASAATVPGGTTAVNWVQAAINTTIVTSTTRYAFGYTAGKSELFPIPQSARDANRNLTQNSGY